jgi:hypothetical protein
MAKGTSDQGTRPEESRVQIVRVKGSRVIRPMASRRRDDGQRTKAPIAQRRRAERTMAKGHYVVRILMMITHTHT